MKINIRLTAILSVALIAAFAGCKASTNKATANTDAGTDTSSGNSSSTSASDTAAGDHATTNATNATTSSASTSSTSSTANSSSVANSHPTSAPIANVPGRYNIIGTNPNGSIYKGALEVVEHGDVYEFRWNAGRQYNGVGIRNGDVIAVSFADGAQGKGCGVVDYVIMDDGTLDGRWGYWGTNESGTERAVRTAGSGLLSTYAATGTNPNGTQYRANLVVAQFGKLYGFAWSNHTEGIGIERGDHISVGIGGKRCGFVSYRVKPDGTLDGVWGGYGTDQTGTEKATKP